MVGMLVPVKGGIGSIFLPPRFGKDYKWYISGIFPANWGMDYATDPTFYGNQKQPLIFGDHCYDSFSGKKSRRKDESELYDLWYHAASGVGQKWDQQYHGSFEIIDNTGLKSYVLHNIW